MSRTTSKFPGATSKGGRNIAAAAQVSPDLRYAQIITNNQHRAARAARLAELLYRRQQATGIVA